MVNINRSIGGILLVSGTATGAGMLALPVLTCFAGFIPSFVAFVACWAFMLITANLILEVNLGFRGDVNMISMAARTLGNPGKFVCWVIYLLLLYALTAAYIAGSAPLFISAFQAVTGTIIPFWIGLFPFLLLFGLFVYLGVGSVDYVNRFLMVGLIGSFIILTIALPSHVNTTLLTHAQPQAIWMAIPVIITSFGFHIIIPTLTTYLNHNTTQLRWIILIGSSLPLLVYLIWEFLILGVVPFQPLAIAWNEGASAVDPLAKTIQSSWISSAAKLFSFFAIITSFLGVSLSLSDFLGDGLKLHRFSWGREIACLLTYLPPLFFVLLYPRGFVLALQYAGLFVAILLGLLPPLMAWNLNKFKHPLKRAGLGVVTLMALGLIWLSLCFT